MHSSQINQCSTIFRRTLWTPKIENNYLDAFGMCYIQYNDVKLFFFIECVSFFRLTRLQKSFPQFFFRFDQTTINRNYIDFYLKSFDSVFYIVRKWIEIDITWKTANIGYSKWPTITSSENNFNNFSNDKQIKMYVDFDFCASPT